MAFNPQNTGVTSTVKKELIPDGTYAGRLARVIELGKHEGKWGEKCQVVMSFTIPELTVEYNGETKQRMITPFSLNFPDEGELLNPDSTVAKYCKALNSTAQGWGDLILKPCMLDISIEKSKSSGKEYNKINSLMRPIGGLDVPMPDCETYVFEFHNPDMEVWEKIPEYYKEQIKQALNFEGSKLASMVV